MRYYYKHKDGKSCYLSLKSPWVDENYIQITEEEFNTLTYVEPVVIDEEAIAREQEIQSLKEQLKATDYQAIKYAEGWISEEDYAPIKASRQAIRDRINELEAV